MGFVHERTDSGLLVARKSGEGAAVADALRDHDRELRLVPQWSQAIGQYWAVYRYQGSERPAKLVCVWVDHERQEAKPLSHGLVDRVKELDRNGQGNTQSADEANAELHEARKKAGQDKLDDLVDDWAKRDKTLAMLPRGQHLRLARSRSGYHDYRSNR